MFIIFVLIIIILFMVIYYKNKRNLFLIKKLNEYETIINDQGEQNHEYNNQLMILSGYLDNKKELEKYLYSIIEDHKTGQNYEIRQLSKLDNIGLKRLLYYKINKMSLFNIKFCPYISENINDILNNISFNTYKDITKVFGILIDNAIDASKDSDDKDIFLYMTKDGNYLSIKIINSINNDIYLNKIGKDRFTTKGKGHGFGLMLVKDILKRNDKIELVTDYNNTNFSQTVLIDLK